MTQRAMFASERCAFAMDPATRGNAWTLVGAFAEKRPAGHRVVVAIARQWIGSRSAPLSPAAVMAEVASIVKRYGSRTVFTDQWSADSIADHGRAGGIRVVEQRYTAEQKVELYSNLKDLLATDRLELPPLPILLADLKGVRRRANGSGIRVELTRTANGRHCDFAPSVAMAAANAPHARRSSDEVIQAPPVQFYHSPLSGGDFGGTWETPARSDGLIPLSEYRAMGPNPTTQALADVLGAEVTRHFQIPKG